MERYPPEPLEYISWPSQLPTRDNYCRQVMALSPAQGETFMALAPEWQGTVEESLDAVRRLLA